MLATIGGDGERLLHQPVRFVSVSVRAAIRVAFDAVNAVTVGVFVEAAASTFALHLTICEEASGHSAGAPRFAVRPSAHARLALVPHEH